MKIKGLEKVLIPLAFVFGMAGGLKAQEIPTNYAKADTIITDNKTTITLYDSLDAPVYKKIKKYNKNKEIEYDNINYYEKDKKVKRFCKMYRPEGVEIITQTYEYDKNNKLIKNLEIVDKKNEIDTFLTKKKYYKDSTIVINKDTRYDKNGKLLFDDIKKYIKTDSKIIRYRKKDDNGDCILDIEEQIIAYKDKKGKITLTKTYLKTDGKMQLDQKREFYYNYLNQKTKIIEYKYTEKDTLITENKIIYNKKGKIEKIEKEKIKDNNLRNLFIY